MLVQIHFFCIESSQFAGIPLLAGQIIPTLHIAMEFLPCPTPFLDPWDWEKSMKLCEILGGTNW